MQRLKYRLPRHAVPRHYELELQPRLAEAAFDGHVTITFDLIEPSDQLVLNAADLTITDPSVEEPSGTTWTGTATVDSGEQQVTVALPRQLPAGEGYRLHLGFSGSLNDHLHGFYRSTFRGDDGAEQVIAITQFEPSDARRAFPCWDEPDFKATFGISLVIDPGLTAVSNALEASTAELDDGRTRVTFADTMPMSTYLVAFVIGPYQLTAPADVDGVALRIATVPGRAHLVGYAEEVASHALRFLSRYFDIPYPAEKIDHVAVPDFAFGAMENLGCVTYRENALLADPDRAAQLELQRIASVVAHETAHMWFGDLVTMKWWNGIWLNEAFATFMELTTTEAYRPEWQVWTAFSAGKSAAMATDGLRATRPVEYEVGRPEEAEAMFDVLTYQKGGAVLRMLEQYLGPETFRKGISHYLSRHAYANTDTDDLWEAIETVSGEPVRSIMDSWIRQGGYPAIDVQETDDPGTVTLRQRRFMYTPVDGDDRTWSVPVSIRASVRGEVQHQQLLLDGRQAACTFDAPVDWVVINDGGWGFYRVCYSPELWSRLRSENVLAVMSPLERLGLVADMWASVVGGTADLTDWASVARAVAPEPDPDVWATLLGVLGVLYGLADEEGRQSVRSFAAEAAAAAWAELGWEADPGEDRRRSTARSRVLGALGLVAADQSVTAEALERFRRYETEPSAVNPDLVAMTSRIAVAAGGEEEWNTVFQRYRDAALPQDKVRYLFSLASSRDPALLERAVRLALSPEVRTQDAPFLISEVMSQPAGAALAWAWFEQHWAVLREKLPSGLLARSFEGIASIVDPDLARSVHDFCGQHDIPLNGPRMDQLLERMDLSVALAARLGPNLSAALAG